MTRAEHRRDARAAAKEQMTVAQLNTWQDQRKLPDKFPVKSADPVFSATHQCNRIISVVERSGVLPHLQTKLKGRRGRKPRVSIQALLVCIMLAMYLLKSYRRSDVVAVLYGLPPAIAEQLGLLDDNGDMKPVQYKRVVFQIIRLEALLLLGWNSGTVRCDSSWFSNSMVLASVPRPVRRSIKAVIVDSTSVEGWARTLHYVRQSDIEKDAFALHRKRILDNPDLPEPEPMSALVAAAARKRGVEVGPDGRIIRTKDLHSRVGHASAIGKRPARFFVGYELTTVVACRTISWNGQPDIAHRGPKVRPYILAIDVTPAGQNPGPIGLRAVLNAIKAAPGINEVVADRAYTVKREHFVRPLHQRNINVVMDYPKSMIGRPDNGTLGRRRQNVVLHCGTVLPDWIANNKRKPPAHLRCKGNEKKLEEWYNERYRHSGYRTRGARKKAVKGGGKQFQCPACAGHAPTPNTPASSYSAPLTAAPGGGVRCCGGKVSARLEDLDTYQEHPYGTTVWRLSYGRRSTVEGPNGKLKAAEGLGGGACQAFGLPANTMAATAAVVAYNLKLTVTNNRTNGPSNAADDGRDGSGNTASNGDSNGSDNAGEDTNSEVLPDWREHANAQIDDDAEPETLPQNSHEHTPAHAEFGTSSTKPSRAPP